MSYALRNVEILVAPFSAWLYWAPTVWNSPDSTTQHSGLTGCGRCWSISGIIPSSWDSVVGIATGYGLDDWGVGVRVPVGLRKNALFSTSSRPSLGSTQLPIQWVPRAFSPRVKLQGREADHSLQTSAEVKKIWIYTSTSSYVFMA
jgi:hypothetical protein